MKQQLHLRHTSQWNVCPYLLLFSSGREYCLVLFLLLTSSGWNWNANRVCCLWFFHWSSCSRWIVIRCTRENLILSWNWEVLFQFRCCYRGIWWQRRRSSTVLEWAFDFSRWDRRRYYLVIFFWFWFIIWLSIFFYYRIWFFNRDWLWLYEEVIMIFLFFVVLVNIFRVIV